MFCTHCGTEANANDRFYHSCGRDLSMAAAAPSGRDAPNAAPIEAVGRPRAEQPSWESPGDRSLGDAQLAGTGRRIGAFAAPHLARSLKPLITLSHTTAAALTHVTRRCDGTQ